MSTVMMMMNKKQSASGKNLWHHLLGKSLNSNKLTLMCSLVTLLVLRGNWGIANIATPTAGIGMQTDPPPTKMVSSAAARDEVSVGEEEEVSMAMEYQSHNIADWDERRRVDIAIRSSRSGGDRSSKRTLMVTGSSPRACDCPAGDHYLLKSLKNKIDYCRRHDIPFFFNQAFMNPSMRSYWSKIPVLRKLMLAHPDIEWIWWVDSDAFFTDMDWHLPMHKYVDSNLVLQGNEEMIYQKRDWLGLNAGIFLLRNCQWSLDLLHSWASMGKDAMAREEFGRVFATTLYGRPKFDADDQSALVYLLATQPQLWRDKVYLESSYDLHGYWVMLANRFEEMDAKGERRPFVTHFVGCKPCGSYGSYPLEECLANMERAFNHGDNQVLATYGFKHSNLSTSSLDRI